MHAGVALRAVMSRAREAARWGTPALLLAVAVTVSTTFTATAYGPPWDAMEGTGTTATGIKLAPAVTPSMNGPYVVAVDPKIIPLGSKLKINPNPFGDPNIVFTAADTGGAIKGNRIDFYDPLGRTHQDSWGRRPVSINIVGKGSPTAASSSSTPAAASSSTPASAPGSSSTPGTWTKLLLDAAFLAFGAAAIYKGARRMTSTQASR